LAKLAGGCDGGVRLMAKGVRVGINGFGRIGRLVFRAHLLP
jgi:phosphoglycerate dehydrogenase-like enzyme